MRLISSPSTHDLYVLWDAFIARLREKWEAREPLSRTEEKPVLTDCIIAQKIQLLSYCINRSISESRRRVGRNTDDYIDLNAENEDNVEGSTLLFTGQQMKEPERQRLGVETSDMREERRILLERIGNSETVEVIRAKIIHPLVFSGMNLKKNES